MTLYALAGVKQRPAVLILSGAGNGTRTRDVQLGRLTLYQLSYSRSLTYHRGAGIGLLVEGGGFEPPKAEPTDLQSAPFGRSGTPPGFGAGDGTRTRNLLITNQLLYRLSYASKWLLYKSIFFILFMQRCQAFLWKNISSLLLFVVHCVHRICRCAPIPIHQKCPAPSGPRYYLWCEKRIRILWLFLRMIRHSVALPQ